MDAINEFLKQSTTFFSTSNGDLAFPYKTNFSFLGKYPYELTKVPIPNGTRIDGLSKKVTGIFNGGKLICIFNDCVSPIELLKKEYIYLPSNFGLAISGLSQQNIKRMGE